MLDAEEEDHQVNRPGLRQKGIFADVVGQHFRIPTVHTDYVVN